METPTPTILACPICKETCHGGAAQRQLAATKCGHVHHKHCLLSWWRAMINRGESRSCPVCRQIALYENCIDLFPSVQMDATITEELDNRTSLLEAEKARSALLEAELTETRRLYQEAILQKEKMEGEMEQKNLMLEYTQESLDMEIQNNAELRTMINSSRQKQESVQQALSIRTAKLFEFSTRCIDLNHQITLLRVGQEREDRNLDPSTIRNSGAGLPLNVNEAESAHQAQSTPVRRNAGAGGNSNRDRGRQALVNSRLQRSNTTRSNNRAPWRQ